MSEHESLFPQSNGKPGGHCMGGFLIITLPLGRAQIGGGRHGLQVGLALNFNFQNRLREQQFSSEDCTHLWGRVEIIWVVAVTADVKTPTV